jgi:nucleotide-binding universal stress UspA family protein
LTPSAVFVGDVRSAGGAYAPEERRAYAKRWLDARAASGGNAAAVLLEGRNVGESLCRWATQNDVSLLVLGQREGGLVAALGSTANYAVRHAPCDVLVVHERHPRAAPDSGPAESAGTT